MVEAAAEDVEKFVESGVLARDRGDSSAWFEGACCAPACTGTKDGVVDEVAEVLRLAPPRPEEVRTEEKVEANGEAKVVLMEGLCEAPLLRLEGSPDDWPKFVVNGVRPRRAPAV